MEHPFFYYKDNPTFLMEIDLLTRADDLSSNTRAVSNLGGGLVSVSGPVELTVVVCGLMLEHPFFYYNNPILLMGIDLFTRAALMTDCASRCVWSKRTLRCHE